MASGQQVRRNAGFANYLQETGPPIEGSSVDPTQGPTPVVNTTPGQYTPGTPGLPGYDPAMQAAQYPLPQGRGMPHGVPVDPYAVPGGGVLTNQPGSGVPNGGSPGGWVPDPYAQAGELGIDPRTGAPTQFSGGASLSGNALSPFLQGRDSAAIAYLVSDPSTYYDQYATQGLGWDRGSGNYALGAPLAGTLDEWWMMTPQGQNLVDDHGAMGQYYEDTINGWFDPGTAYYTTGDFIGQAFQQGTRMWNYVFGDTVSQDGSAMPKDTSQIMSDLFSAMEGVLGTTMDPGTLDALMQMYAVSYREYLDAIMQPNSPAGTMTLYQWFESQGLGLSMLGG